MAAVAAAFRDSAEPSRSDSNPIYGLYYFSEDSRMYTGECEAADTNDFYEAS